MKIKKKWGQKIYIEWIDACTEDGWKSISDMLKVPNEVYCYTSGWYIGQNKDFIIISHTKGKTNKNEMMGKLLIPKAWIRKVK